MLWITKGAHPNAHLYLILVRVSPVVSFDTPTHQAHRAANHTSALFTSWLACNAHTYTSARSTDFFAIWVCIRSSSSPHRFFLVLHFDLREVRIGTAFATLTRISRSGRLKPHEASVNPSLGASYGML